MPVEFRVDGPRTQPTSSPQGISGAAIDRFTPDPSNRELDALLERVTGEVRDETLNADVVNRAVDDVWTKISEERSSLQAGFTPVERLRTCTDFQALIPAYLHGNLSPSRALLLEDHSLECIPCRKALKEARVGSVNAAPAAGFARAKGLRAQPALLKWGIAAVVLIGLSALVGPLAQRFLQRDKNLQAVVQAADGPVYRIADAQSQPVFPGSSIERGERIRTARAGGAVVRLGDGSLVEMKERSEISMTEGADGVTIRLRQGNIIVQAAHQRPGHLYVTTGDCLVSVTGTIFSVTSGTKGSRVSVIQGEVRVEAGGQQQVLHPGDQISTQPSLERVAVKDEIAWSRDAERYSKLLAELSAVRKEIDERVARPGVRLSTRLLDLVPEGTVLYVAIPNLSAMLDEANQLMEERIQQNPALREWWERERTGGRRGPGLGPVMTQMSEFGPYLGEEIVVSAEIDERGEPDVPLVLADLRDPVGFRAFLEQKAETLGARGNKRPLVRIVDDPHMALQQPKGEGPQPEVNVWIHDGLMAASPHLSSLARLSTGLTAPSANRFQSSSFYTSIAAIYREGAGLIVAADLQRIIAGSLPVDTRSERESRKVEAFRQLGFLNLKHFILELKEQQGKAKNRAVLTFDQPRRGIAAWLAAPGPMGALEFISPDANVVTAFVVDQPVALVDDLMTALGTMDPRLKQELTAFETESGVSIRNDLAASLGGEFAFAIDGPLLPMPAWKMVFEVYDPAHLQQTLERLVDRLNQRIGRQGRNYFEWAQAESGGRTFYTLRTAKPGLEFNYAYSNGFLVAAPQRALVERALQYRSSGYTLVRSPRFIAALPEDGNANFSALFYQNLATALEPIARQLGGGGKERHGDGRDALRARATSAPALAYAYAQGDRIIFAANSENGPLGLSPASLLGLPGSFGLRSILEGAMR